MELDVAYVTREHGAPSSRSDALYRYVPRQAPLPDRGPNAARKVESRWPGACVSKRWPHAGRRQRERQGGKTKAVSDRGLSEADVPESKARATQVARARQVGEA